MIKTLVRIHTKRTDMRKFLVLILLADYDCTELSVFAKTANAALMLAKRYNDRRNMEMPVAEFQVHECI